MPDTTCHMSMSLDGFVMGRNMFGPIRGDWDEEWTGWWSRHLALPAGALASRLLRMIGAARHVR